MDDVIAVMPDGRGASGGVRRRSVVLGTLALAGGAAVAALTRYLFIDAGQAAVESGVVVVPQRDVPQPGDAPVYVPAGRFYLVNLRPGEGGMELPGQGDLVGSTRGGLLALNDRCTHMGCHLPWRPDFRFLGSYGWFRCPCHSATYTKAGQRVFGPAPRSMDTPAFTVHSDGSVSVYFTQIRAGGFDDPQRAVPLR